MPPGPRPIPTALKRLAGNPGQYRLNSDPQYERPEKLPAPPRFLSKFAAAEWRRTVVELDRLRLLTVVDLGPLAAYCQAFGLWHRAELELRKSGQLLVAGHKGVPFQNPLVKIAQAAARDMVRYASEFGFTPAARSRIDAKPEAPRSKFGELTN